MQLPDSPDTRLMHWLQVVRTYQHVSTTLSALLLPLGLKLPQHEVLLNLLHSQQLTQQQLAKRSYVTKGHMSGLLADMAERGWIERESNATDARSKSVSLTPDGQALALQAQAQQMRVVNAMANALDPGDMHRLSHMMTRMDAALQTLRANA